VLDTRASAHTISEQAELLIACRKGSFRVYALDDQRGLSPPEMEQKFYAK
jgi:hypothetical protein